MEFGLNQYSQLSGIQNNTQAYFSNQDVFCESKEAYSKKMKSPQNKFNSLDELEFCIFNEGDKEEDPSDQFIKTQIHKAADNVGDTATKLISRGVAKYAVKRKHGVLGNWRTNRARRKYANGFANRYGSSINQLAHIGADAVHEKYGK
jgi:hypothetical protein